MTLNVNNLPSQIRIGVVGENDARIVQIDWSDWAEQYGAGAVTVLLQRSGDTNPYPVVTSTEGTVTTWLPSSTDTAAPGFGKIQIEYRVNSVVAKTEIFRVQIAKSLTPETDPPDPYESWLDTLTDLASETEQNAQDAAQSATEAETSASSAGQSATSASASASSAESSANSAASSASSASASATAAESSATSASGSASSASASASSATQSATSASQSASSASQSATQASGSASSASASATAAATSESNASESAQSASASATSAEASAESAAQSASEALETLLDTAPVITDTASGAIASFSDGADGRPVVGLSVGVEPVQDLHGQSAPYPAGGGVNKVNPSDLTPGWIYGGDGTICPQDSTKLEYTSDFIEIPSGTTYVTFGYDNYGANISDRWVAVGLYDENKDFVVRQIGTWVSSTSGLATYNISSYTTAKYARFCTRTYGHGTEYLYGAFGQYSTFSPYENICPITGHTQAVVTRTGGNLFQSNQTTDVSSNGITSTAVVNDCQSTFSGTANATIGFTILKAPVKNGATYTVTHTGASMNLHAITRAYKGDTYVKILQDAISPGSITFQVDDTFDTVDFRPTVPTGLTVSNATMKAALIPGNGPAVFEPYQAQTITIPFGSTIYGGTVDVVNGVLTVDRAMVTFDGTQTIGLANWRPFSDSSAWLYSPSATPGFTNQSGGDGLISDRLASIPYTEETGGIYGDNIGISAVGSDIWGIAMRVPVTGLTTSALINAWLTDNPITVVYELATPIEIPLTAQQLTTLLGDNNVWADTGNTTVEYRADTKKYIQKMIAAALSA